jgi:hypothetical protein
MNDHSPFAPLVVIMHTFWTLSASAYAGSTAQARAAKQHANAIDRFIFGFAPTLVRTAEK